MSSLLCEGFLELHWVGVTLWLWWSGFSLWWLLFLQSTGSRVVVALGLIALGHVGSSRIRDQTCVPCIGRWILNHWTTREAPAGGNSDARRNFHERSFLALHWRPLAQKEAWLGNVTQPSLTPGTPLFSWFSFILRTNWLLRIKTFRCFFRSLYDTRCMNKELSSLLWKRHTHFPSGQRVATHSGYQSHDSLKTSGCY